MNWKIKNFYLIMTVETIAEQMFVSLTYLLLIYLGYSMTEIGLLLATFTATTMVAEIPSGILVDSIGEKRVMSLSFLLRAIGLFFMAGTRNIVVLILTAVLTGLAVSLSSGTLQSWIVNEIKEANAPYDIAQVFSNLKIIGPFFGLLSGFVGAQFLGKDNPAIPFYVASAILIGLLVYVQLVPNVFKPRPRQNHLGQIKQVYRETVVNLIEALKDSRILLYFIMFSIPAVLDLGPSNQWQVILGDAVQEYIVGYYIIGIGLATILSNLFLSKVLLKKKMDMVALIDRVLLLDVVTLLVISFYLPVFPYLFLFHVFLVGINGTLIITYIHEKLIKQDHLRTSLVSSFYSLQALASSLLLTVNGYLSDLIGISKTWIAFTLISMLVFLALLGLTARKEESQT
ncbi:MFS transporter [Abiotrophia defectiva]|uniref:MFS transporter n=1 Tax=Abiotrophia defectiva TaxID=46125 RepID=UPI002280A714|nr:MFS transporter [Abiotrophia defectiva]MCY7225834.1 MFS transporter [Abiotrophia defectiva]